MSGVAWRHRAAQNGTGAARDEGCPPGTRSASVTDHGARYAADVARRVGLSSATNLRRCFLGALGTTPGAYRRAFRAGLG